MGASGADGFIFKDTDMGMSCNGKLDVKDYPCSGPMKPTGFTVAWRPSGRSL